MGERARTGLRWLLAAAYLFVGYVHVTKPHFFMAIMPPWVPWPLGVIVATGWCEIAGAVGLVIPRIRWLAGVMLALYAVCVYPANVQHALIDLRSGTGLGWWYHGPRLLAQPLLVWWALYAGGVTWPSRRAPGNR